MTTSAEAPPSVSANDERRWRAWLAAFVVWEGAALGLVRWSWVSGHAFDFGVLAQLAAGAPIACWAIAQWRGGELGLSARGKVAMVLAAIALRLILIDLAPALSDDIYRYLWEGRVQRAGENPYRYAPEAPELATLRTPEWELINHPEYSAIYPPLTQAVFALCTLIYPSVVTLKIAFVLFDLLVLIALMRWLERLGRSASWAALWAFHPLVIVEFSGNGHLDSLMILMVVAALLNLEAGREGWSVAALAGAVAAKLIPLLLLPFFFWKMRRRRLLALVPVIVLVSYLPYAGAGRDLASSLWVYQRDWLYNSPIFDLARDRLFSANGWLARYWFYGALASIAGILWIRRASPAAAALPVVGFYQIAGPVVHPWYLAQFLPLAAARQGGWPWIWLTLAAPLVYLDEASPRIRAAVWGPFLLGLLIEGLRAGLCASKKNKTQSEADA